MRRPLRPPCTAPRGGGPQGAAAPPACCTERRPCPANTCCRWSMRPASRSPTPPLSGPRPARGRG
eukprot:11162161-Lingulodinium_polyedra.AAC.1